MLVTIGFIYEGGMEKCTSAIGTWERDLQVIDTLK